jgi:SOS-response transcriptional repressor LexA
MPATAMPTCMRRDGVYAVLEWKPPGQARQPFGVLLLDPVSGRTWMKVRERADGIDDPLDAEVFEAMGRELRELLDTLGPDRFWRDIEEDCSNSLTVSERRPVAVDAFTRVLTQLYGEHVEADEVRPFETHVPLYSLRAAAGALGDEMPSEQEDWVPAPPGMRLSPDMFVAHVVGRSMEPRIPDGSLNLFRMKPAGSRQGKILLVERFGITDESARYTVKRYTSEKRSTGENGEWEHTRIRLEPLNPEFEPWDVEPQDFAVVAEWLRVLE